MIARRALLAFTLLLAPIHGIAGWWEVTTGAAAFDLVGARAAALDTVAHHANGADAVAAAGWWLRNLDHLPEPEAILSAAAADQDPELAFILARIEGELTVRPPLGALTPVDLAGAFGSYSTLDIDRDVVPADADLPPMNTPWRGPEHPFRLRLSSVTGRVTTPDLLYSPGVHLAAWTVALDEDLHGWLVVEASGNINLQVDGVAVDRLRNCGLEDPGVVWYAFAADAGRHRIRVEMSGTVETDVRVSVLEATGRAADLQIGHGTAGPWARSMVERSSPPARSALRGELSEDGGSVQSTLMAAALAAMTSDPREEQTWIEAAMTRAPDDPWPHLAMAAMLLGKPMVIDQEVAERQARDHLRKARSIPTSLLFERALALRQKRAEDQDRLLDEMVDRYSHDPRVLRMWVAESVRRGWVREAEEGMATLLGMLPESIGVLEIRLAVLEALERWQERNALLVSLAGEGGLGPRRIEQLAGSCFSERAIAGLRELSDRVDDPMLDLGIARLLIETERPEEARTVLEQARSRWGELAGIHRLELVLSPIDSTAVNQPLEKALARDPSNVDLRALAWRSGAEPFFAPYSVDALQMAAEQPESVDDVDAVVMLDQAVERLFADGSSIYYYHGLTRTQTPEGARRAAVLQQLPNALLLRVRIIKPDGRVVIPAELNSRNGNIVLGDVKEGDLVEEEYVAGVPPSHPALRGHISPYVYRFADPERAFGLSEYVLLVPEEVDLKAGGNFEGLDREEWLEDGLRGIRWLATSVAPVPPEPLAPPNQELLPWVTYGFGVGWQDVGDSMRDRVLPVLRSSAELDRWSEPLIAGDDPKAVVRRLVEALFDEVEVGQAPLELRSSAGESFSRRQGNRMGIVAAILIRAGWQVDLVLARPLPFAGSQLEVPTMEAFSLPILRVARDGQEMWLDLSEDLSGIDHIDPMLQGSDGLLLPLSSPTAEVRVIEPLPTFDNPDLEERMWVTARLDARGWAQMEVATELRGAQAEGIDQRLKSIPEEQVPLVYAQLASNIYPGAEEVSGEVERVGDTLKLRLRMELPRACTIRNGTMECFELMPSTPLVPALAALPSRNFPLVLRMPVLQRTELVLRTPPGWKLERSPRRLEARWGSVSESLEISGAELRSVLRLNMPAQTVETEDYPEFARFCHAVDELIQRPEILQRAVE